MKLNIRTVRAYITTYVQGGLSALCQAETRPRAGALTPQQEQDFKTILLTTRPTDHQLKGNIWTAAIMREYIQQTYQVDYHSGIYNLLARLGLTHQRAHADYGNACIEQQQACWQTIETALLSDAQKHAVVSFDEFSVTQKPTTYYGWAEKNTRPVVVTDEKKGRG
jgi:transposase